MTHIRGVRDKYEVWLLTFIHHTSPQIIGQYSYSVFCESSIAEAFSPFSMTCLTFIDPSLVVVVQVIVMVTGVQIC